MSQDKAMVRDYVERLEGVSKTHFELDIKGATRNKTLVVEVDFDLDPNSSGYSRAKIDAIADAFATMMREDNAEVVSKLKIVSRAQPSASKSASAVTGQAATPAKSAPAEARPTPN